MQKFRLHPTSDNFESEIQEKNKQVFCVHIKFWEALKVSVEHLIYVK